MSFTIYLNPFYFLPKNFYASLFEDSSRRKLLLKLDIQAKVRSKKNEKIQNDYKSFPVVRGVYMRKYLKYGTVIGIIMGTFPWILNLFIPVNGLWVTLGIFTNPIGTLLMFFYPVVFFILGKSLFHTLFAPLYVGFSIITWTGICYLIQKLSRKGKSE